MGDSAMGTLFASRDPDAGDDLVIAIASDPDAEAGHSKRMRREALTLMELCHPNLISIRDVGALHGRLYVIMEWPPGQPIDQVLAAKPHSWRTILALYSDAGRGLAAAHGRAVVHGAVSPGCIRVAEDGRVRVTDFALVRAPGTADSDADADAEPAGQPAAHLPFQAPECARGARATIFSDQYSFATSLETSLLGHGKWGRCGLPVFVDRALQRARADNPRERYPSIYELLHDLEPPRWPWARIHGLALAVTAVAAALAATLAW